MPLHTTPEYAEALKLAGTNEIVGCAYVLLAKDHEVRALSYNGALRLAMSVMNAHRVNVCNVGNYGGAYANCDESTALIKFKSRSPAP